jgi:hypothetical protein
MNIPLPELKESVDLLRDRKEYQAVLLFIREERERLFADMGPVSEPYEIMKIAGGIARLDELLQNIS